MGSRKYTCPMHPQIVQDKSGTCPICGMSLVLVKEKQSNAVASPHQHGANPSTGHTGHNHHAMMIADFRKRFYAVLILTVAIIHGVMGLLKQLLHIQSYYGMFIILLFWLGSRKLIDWMINRRFPE